MKIVCNDNVVINLSHPVFRKVLVFRKSRTILAIGSGFCMKFFYYKVREETYYGDFIEVFTKLDRKKLEKIIEEVGK